MRRGVPGSTASLSVVRANNGAAATAFRVMRADVIRLAAVRAGCRQTSWAFWELLLMRAFEGSCHWDVTRRKAVIVLSYYLTNCITYFGFFKATRVLLWSQLLSCSCFCGRRKKSCTFVSISDEYACTHSKVTHPLEAFHIISLIKDCKRLHEELQSFSSLSRCKKKKKQPKTSYIIQQKTTLKQSGDIWTVHLCSCHRSQTLSHSLLTDTSWRQWLLYGSPAVYRPAAALISYGTRKHTPGEGRKEKKKYHSRLTVN